MTRTLVWPLPLSTIFSASAVLHEANLLSLLTELLTLHHDAIPLFSGNVLIWTKKNHFDLGTELKLVVQSAGWISSETVGLFSKPWKESHNSFSLFHVTFGSGPCRRDGQRRGSCAGPAAFVMEKPGSRQWKNINERQIIQPQVAAFKLCCWFRKFATDLKSALILLWQALDPGRPTHRGAEGDFAVAERHDHHVGRRQCLPHLTGINW